jgi:hypothetical protein
VYWILTQLEMLTSALNPNGVILLLWLMGKTNLGKHVNICTFRQRRTIWNSDDKITVFESAKGMNNDELF